jgi:hypothetical protein
VQATEGGARVGVGESGDLGGGQIGPFTGDLQMQTNLSKRTAYPFKQGLAVEGYPCLVVPHPGTFATSEYDTGDIGERLKFIVMRNLHNAYNMEINMFVKQIIAALLFRLKAGKCIHEKA